MPHLPVWDYKERQRVRQQVREELSKENLAYPERGYFMNPDALRRYYQEDSGMRHPLHESEIQEAALLKEPIAKLAAMLTVGEYEKFPADEVGGETIERAHPPIFKAQEETDSTKLRVAVALGLIPVEAMPSGDLAATAALRIRERITGESYEEMEKQLHPVLEEREPAPPPRGKLPDDFPGKLALDQNDITTYGQVRKVITSGNPPERFWYEDVPGVGSVTAEKIEEAIAAKPESEDEAE